MKFNFGGFAKKKRLGGDDDTLGILIISFLLLHVFSFAFLGEGEGSGCIIG